MVMFAVSGALVLALVCWAMLRESPPVAQPDEQRPVDTAIDGEHGEHDTRSNEPGAGSEIETPTSDDDPVRDHVVDGDPHPLP